MQDVMTEGDDFRMGSSIILDLGSVPFVSRFTISSLYNYIFIPSWFCYV